MNEIARDVKRVSRGGIVFGIVLVILGILSIMAPLFSGVAVTLLVGFFMIAAGIARLVWAFQAGSFGKGVLTFLLGGLFIVTGILMLARPLAGLASLAMVVGAFFLVDGIFEMAAAFKIKPAEGWGWMLFGGIASIVLAGMIWWDWPFSGAWAIGVLVGVKLLFSGTAMIAIGSAGSRLASEVDGSV